MKRTKKQINSETESETITRRKFLERSAASTALTAAAAIGHAHEARGAGKQKSSEPLMGEMIEYKSGDMNIPAYLSRPKKRGALPGAVLVIHEVFGLNEHIKTIADRIANEGYAALAPNLFVRAPEPPPKDASDMAALRKAVSSIPIEFAIKDMQAGLDFFKTLNSVHPHYASIGFCMGGGFSYQIATHSKDLRGAAIFYGQTPVELVPQVSCPLLCSFGALDTGIPPEKVRGFEEALKRAGKQADIKVYPGAKHGFFNDTRPEAYNAEAAADAWQRVRRFFQERLGK